MLDQLTLDQFDRGCAYIDEQNKQPDGGLTGG
jgi:hypothetical protein